MMKDVDVLELALPPAETRPTDCCDVMNDLNWRALLVASCFRGALPPVDLRAVCLVRAMTDLETVGLLDVRLLKRPLGVQAEVLCGGCCRLLLLLLLCCPRRLA